MIEQGVIKAEDINSDSDDDNKGKKASTMVRRNKDKKKPIKNVEKEVDGPADNQEEDGEAVK